MCFQHRLLNTVAHQGGEAGCYQSCPATKQWGDFRGDARCTYSAAAATASRRRLKLFLASTSMALLLLLFLRRLLTVFSSATPAAAGIGGRVRPRRTQSRWQQRLEPRPEFGKRREVPQRLRTGGRTAIYVHQGLDVPERREAGAEGGGQHKQLLRRVSKFTAWRGVVRENRTREEWAPLRHTLSETIAE